jgi:ComF family protein
MIKAIIKYLSYAFFPRRCELCGQVVELNKPLCDDCNKNKRLLGETCKRCGCMADDCKCKLSDKYKYDSVIAPFYFDNGIKIGIYNLKFHGYTELAAPMAKEMAKAINEKYSELKFDFVTYVPLSKKSFRKRGYNQAELLAKSVAAELSLECRELLVKVCETGVQHKSTAKERKQNLKNAFELNTTENVKNKTILIVDDVKTTGSTFNECSAVLKKGGASSVYAAALAITKIKIK